METENAVVVVHFLRKIKPILIVHCPLKGQNVRDIYKYRVKSLPERAYVELNLSWLYILQFRDRQFRYSNIPANISSGTRGSSNFELIQTLTLSFVLS